MRKSCYKFIHCKKTMLTGVHESYFPLKSEPGLSHEALVKQVLAHITAWELKGVVVSLRLTYNNENEARSSRFSGVMKRSSVYYERVFSKETEIMGLLLSGFADEAAKGLRDQIAIHKQFGIPSLEIRNIDGVNIGQMTDAQFEEVYRILQEEEMNICGFGSAIANWATPITTDFQKDLDELNRLIPRMKRLGTKIIRIMSYPNDGYDEWEWKKHVIHRLGILAALAEQEGVILGHENCDGWGAQSPENLRILLEEVNSPAFQAIFDSGNPIAHGGTTEDVWAFYQAAKPWICHFHIKDGYRNDKNEVIHCYPGEGWADMKAIMNDLLESGYQGYFSMEPHIAVQVHISSEHPEQVDVRGIYEEYCRRTIALTQDLNYK